MPAPSRALRGNAFRAIALRSPTLLATGVRAFDVRSRPLVPGPARVPALLPTQPCCLPGANVKRGSRAGLRACQGASPQHCKLAMMRTGKCGVPLPPPASGHHRSIVVASIFSVKLSATGTPLCGRIRGNSLVPRRSWRAFPPAERQPTSASKCLENAENRTPFPWNAGLTSLGRENRVASRENFSDSRGHGPNPRHVHRISRWPRAAVR